MPDFTLRPPRSTLRPVSCLVARVAGALLLAQAACGEPDPTPSEPEQPRRIRVQVLAFNDFHGNIEPPSGANGLVTTVLNPDGSSAGEVTAGGAAYLAHWINTLRADNPNTVVVSAGDLIGTSPLVSGVAHDEPTIEVMNQIGLDLNAVGNHEFDEGFAELLRMQTGGCHPEDGCQDGTPFAGATFKFLAANVFTDLPSRRTLLPSYVIREFEGVKVAFIGMTLENTGAIVNASGVAGLSFQDEADTANALVPELKQQGVEAIVVVIHEGGFPTGLYDECVGVSGAIVQIVERLDPAVDAVVSGHTHSAYNCVINGKRVTSAASFGRVLTDLDLELDADTREVVESSARNVLVTRQEADPAIASAVATYVARAAPLRDRVLGITTGALKRPPQNSVPAGTSGESTLGDVVADSMLEATKEPRTGGAVIAFVNPGGVRADLAAGSITYGAAFNVQPFDNNLTTLTLTGAQLEAVLEQQFQPGGATRILQASRGFAYAYSNSAPIGSKVDAASITLNGTVLDPAASYRVTVNNYLAGGGGGFSVIPQGTNLVTGPSDLDAFVAYLRVNNPLVPPAQDRITLLP
jgi:5'-nucleotidase